MWREYGLSVGARLCSRGFLPGGGCFRRPFSELGIALKDAVHQRLIGVFDRSSNEPAQFLLGRHIG